MLVSIRIDSGIFVLEKKKNNNKNAFESRDDENRDRSIFVRYLLQKKKKISAKDLRRYIAIKLTILKYHLIHAHN